MMTIEKLNKKFPKYGIKTQLMQPLVEGEFAVMVTISVFEEMPKDMIGKGNPTVLKEVNAVRSAEEMVDAEDLALGRCIQLLGVK
jgi:hypothetical protein